VVYLRRRRGIGEDRRRVLRWHWRLPDVVTVTKISFSSRANLTFESREYKKFSGTRSRSWPATQSPVNSPA